MLSLEYLDVGIREVRLFIICRLEGRARRPSRTKALTDFDLAITIMQGLAQARLDKFDILGFDACLMAAFEAVAKFSKYCDYYLASEELEPGHGWNWNALDVLQSADVSPLALASSIADGFLQHVRALSSFEGDDLLLPHKLSCPNPKSPTLTLDPPRTLHPPLYPR